MFQTINRVWELQNESGANKKKEIIAKYMDDEKFCKFLYYALNPMITYKISEQTLYKQIRNHPDVKAFEGDFFDLCEFLSHKKALDDETVKMVGSFIYEINEPIEAHICTKLLAKTLRLGVTGKTVNKIIPGLIPEWEVQQAYPIEKYPIKDGEKFYVTEKLNGVRATYYNGELYARSGVPFSGLRHITEVLDRLESDFVFDGELLLKDKGSLSDNESFRIATGIINSENEDKTEISYTIFDVIPISEFESMESSLCYGDRRGQLEYINDLLSGEDSIRVLPLLYCGKDQSVIDDLLDQAVKEDKEGLMINLDVPYKCKRHRGILKVKRFYTMDLPIIGYEEGTGRLAGRLGSLIVDFRGNKVNVGSGFTDDQRDEFWSRRDELEGMICEVKYKEISYDKSSGEESLQFPVFVSLRMDKDEVNIE